MPTQSFKDLIVWQRSIELVKAIYTLSRELPAEERFGLCSQMQRCSVSIPSNIAEGYKRKSLGDYIRFLNIADGSAAELETQLVLVSELYPSVSTVNASGLLLEVQKMLVTMVTRLALKTNR